MLEGRNFIAVFIDPGFMPSRPFGNEECLSVGIFILQQLRQELRVVDVAETFGAETAPLGVELIGEALDEEHPEDELLELRGVHFASQDVRGFEEKGFEL